MKNLKNYGVQELDAKEIKETQGGGILAWLAGAIVGVLATSGNAINDPLNSEVESFYQYATGGEKV